MSSPYSAVRTAPAQGGETVLNSGVAAWLRRRKKELYSRLFQLPPGAAAMPQRFAIAAGALVLWCAMSSPAQENGPKYPRVNVATIWSVDAKWPQRPDNATWGNVPGIAVDEKDHVYVFTRAEPPVQVYDASGKYLRGCGKGIGSPHHIKIDSNNYVWIADTGNHVVEKYTSDGKLLLTLGTKGKAGRDTAHLYRPCDMAFGANGDVYVADGYG